MTDDINDVLNWYIASFILKKLHSILWKVTPYIIFYSLKNYSFKSNAWLSCKLFWFIQCLHINIRLGMFLVVMLVMIVFMSTDDYRHVRMVKNVITNATKKCASDLPHTTCSHYYHVDLFVLRYSDDFSSSRTCRLLNFSMKLQQTQERTTLENYWQHISICKHIWKKWMKILMFVLFVFII